MGLFCFYYIKTEQERNVNIAQRLYLTKNRDPDKACFIGTLISYKFYQQYGLSLIPKLIIKGLSFLGEGNDTFPAGSLRSRAPAMSILSKIDKRRCFIQEPYVQSLKLFVFMDQNPLAFRINDRVVGPGKHGVTNRRFVRI